MNDDEKRLAQLALGRADAATLVQNKLAQVCPDDAVQRGTGESPMGDSNEAVQRGQLCSKCPDILAGIARIEERQKADGEANGRRLTHLREVQVEIFTKIEHVNSTTAKQETALAVLAEKIKAEADATAQTKADRAENRATWKSAGLLIGGTAIWEWVKWKAGIGK